MSGHDRPYETVDVDGLVDVLEYLFAEGRLVFADRAAADAGWAAITELHRRAGRGGDETQAQGEGRPRRPRRWRAA